MKSFIPTLILALTISCSLDTKKGNRPSLEIIEIAPDKQSALTKQNLLQLTQVYDLEPFLFTHRVIINSKASTPSPQSVTLLTLNSESPLLLLSDFIHEQFKFWLDLNDEKVLPSLAEIKKKLPRKSLEQTRKIVTQFLEYRALRQLVGTPEVSKIMRLKKNQNKSYKEIVIHEKIIEKVLKKNSIIPEVLF